MSLVATRVQTRVLRGFDDPQVTPGDWARLLQRGSTDTVNLTWEWQRTWWDTFGRGRLLLLAAYRKGDLVAVAPWFAEAGMVCNLCPEDHLDFVGDVGDPDVLDALLNSARRCVPDFLGFRLFFIADRSPTARLLREAAGRLGLEVVEEAELACPALDLVGQAEHARACTRKKSLRRHEQYFRREGRLEVQHFRQSEEILPHLNDFFEQHVTRRAATNHPSLFSDPRQRDYYRRLTCAIGSTGWLRFTRVLWNGRPIAFHYGLSYRGRFLFGIPAFAIDLARHSPGEVLLRQLLLLAIEEGATTFDFGPGDEAYKYRFATHVTYLRTWGLYPC